MNRVATPITCIRCNVQVLDLRYLVISDEDGYVLEYHCSTHYGGCDFYRLLTLDFHELIGRL